METIQIEFHNVTIGGGRDHKIGLKNADCTVNLYGINVLAAPKVYHKSMILSVLSGQSLQYRGEIVINGLPLHQWIGMSSVVLDHPFYSLRQSGLDVIRQFIQIFHDFEKEELYSMIEIMRLPYWRKLGRWRADQIQLFQLLLALCRQARIYYLMDPFRGLKDEEIEQLVEFIKKRREATGGVVLLTSDTMNEKYDVDSYLFFENNSLSQFYVFGSFVLPEEKFREVYKNDL